MKQTRADKLIDRFEVATIARTKMGEILTDEDEAIDIEYMRAEYALNKALVKEIDKTKLKLFAIIYTNYNGDNQDLLVWETTPLLAVKAWLDYYHGETLEYVFGQECLAPLVHPVPKNDPAGRSAFRVIKIDHNPKRGAIGWGSSTTLVAYAQES